MELKRKVWRMVVCASSVVAILAWAPFAGAAGKQQTKVNHPQKSATKAAPVSKGAAAKRAAVKRTSHKRTGVKRTSQKPNDAELAVSGALSVKSSAALVVDLEGGHTIFGKNPKNVTPIASITKLMTAMVVLDANRPLEETIYIDSADLDFVKGTHSRLGIGTGLLRRDMLRLALMSSENRAAASLGRTYPGGSEAFVAAMNRKAVELGMWNTRFVDATGLSSENVSTADDLVKMVKGAYQYPLIREFTTTPAHEVETAAGRNLQFRNSNGLVKNPTWEIGLSKTGYISEAGRCLVMLTTIATRTVVIVLLDSLGTKTRLGDANRIKKWMESHVGSMPSG